MPRLDRPKSYWDVVGHHLPLALVSGVALLASVVVKPGRHLPFGACWFLNVTGYPCPFCGMTRAFVAMAHGQWAAAFANSPLAAVLFLCVAAVFAWNAAALITRRRIRADAPVSGTKLAAALVVLTVMNWVYRICVGLR